MSPGRESMTSKSINGSRMMTSVNGVSNKSGMLNGQKIGQFLDVHKKTGIELRASPSKNAKIVMKYINNYYDVGPIQKQQAITYQNLEEMAKNQDKKEIWMRNDQRLIFAIEDKQILDESIEQLNKILTSQ